MCTTLIESCPQFDDRALAFSRFWKDVIFFYWYNYLSGKKKPAIKK